MGGEKTYYDMRGRPCSRIDYLLIPIRQKERLEVKVLTKIGFEIQAAQRCLMPIDHMPFQVQIKWRTLLFGFEDQHNRGWNQSQMLDCWVTGIGRELFLMDLVEKMNHVEQRYNEIDKQNNATAMYQTVHGVARESSKTTFLECQCEEYEELQNCWVEEDKDADYSLENEPKNTVDNFLEEIWSHEYSKHKLDNTRSAIGYAEESGAQISDFDDKLEIKLQTPPAGTRKQFNILTYADKSLS